ncbi:MAG: hypothetical protein KBG29_13645, partial [Pseudomonadales bacterium]|nr:hypothetical protein [Pseudomonadales bacterium]
MSGSRARSNPIVRKDHVFFARARNNAAHRAPDAELLRSELFSIEQLKRHAVTLAGQHPVVP